MGGASKQLYAKKMKKEKDAAEAVKKAEEEVLQRVSFQEMIVSFKLENEYDFKRDCTLT